MIMKKCVTVMGVALGVAVAAYGQMVDWTAQEADWNTGASWFGGVVPGEGDTAQITNNGIAVISGDVPKINSLFLGCVVRWTEYSGTVRQIGGHLTIAGGRYPMLIGYDNTTGFGLYDILGGTLSVTGGVFIGSAEQPAPSNGTGMLSVRGTGVMEHSGTPFYVGHYGRTGIVSIADSGRLQLNDGPMLLGAGPVENAALLEMSGGTFSVPQLEMARGSAQAKVDVSGGSLWLDALEAGLGSAEVLLRDCSLGALSSNGAWSAPMTLGGTVTVYTGDAQGAARVNTVSGLLPGAGVLCVSNAPGQAVPGWLTLRGAGDFASLVRVSGGNTVELDTDGQGHDFSFGMDFLEGGVLAFNSADTVTNSVGVSGAVDAVVQNGAGTLVLTNTAPVYGSAVVNNGVMRFASAAAIPGIGERIFLNNYSAVAVDGAYPTVTAWLQSGRISVGSIGAMALSADSAEGIDFSAAAGGAYAAMSLGAVGDVTYTGNLAAVGGVRRLGGGNGTLTYATPIANGSVVVDGDVSTVVLSSPNTFDGGIVVNGGTLLAGHSDGLGSGLLLVSNGTVQVDSPLNVPGGVAVADTGLVQVGPGGTLNAVVTNDAFSEDNSAGLVFNGDSVFTHTEDVAGEGMLAVAGGGTLRLETPGQEIFQHSVLIGNYGSPGHLDMSDGVLNVNEWMIVACGALKGTPLSTFTLSGGAVNKAGSGETIIGDFGSEGSPAEGRMTVSGDAVFSLDGGEFIVGKGSSGTLTVEGGGQVLQTMGALKLGERGGTGTVYLHDDGEISLTQLSIGHDGKGVMTQTGGMLTQNNLRHDWKIGGERDGEGTLNLEGGIFDLGPEGRNLMIGADGRGTLNQSGGQLIARGGWLTVGRGYRSTGEAIITGGSLEHTNPNSAVIVGEEGLGRLSVSGSGSVLIDCNLGLIVGHQPAYATGIVTLATGGLISTTKSQKYGNPSLSYGEFNFDGGILQARRDGRTISDFMEGLNAVYVRDGGAIIDSSNNVVTVAQDLQSGAMPDGGLTKLGSGILILSGTNSYNGLTTVEEGILRLGRAEAVPRDSDVLVRGGIYDLGGLAITNARVTLDSGSILNGRLESEFVGTDSGRLAISVGGEGDFTKTGEGILTVFQPQHYLGKTTVAGGTLEFASSKPAVIHYDFEEENVSGVTVRNLGTGGDAYDGIINGTPTFADSSFGRGFVVADSTRNVVTASPIALTNALTFAAWVKSYGAAGQYQRIILNDYGASGYLGTDGGNKFLGIIRGNFITSPQSSADTVHWHHLAMTWDGAEMIIYYDGEAILTQDLSGFDASFNSVIAFGNNIIPGGEFWNGALDETCVFDYALSGEDVSMLMYTGRSQRDGLLPETTTLELANGASVALNGHSQTVASLTGDGSVTGGVLTVTGIVAPGGESSIGTLTVDGNPLLTGTLQAYVDDAECGQLAVLGDIDLSQLTLELTNPGALNLATDYTIITCDAGLLTGEFQDVIGLPPGWRIRYDRANGKVQVIAIKGTLILLR